MSACRSVSQLDSRHHHTVTHPGAVVRNGHVVQRGLGYRSKNAHGGGSTLRSSAGAEHAARGRPQSHSDKSGRVCRAGPPQANQSEQLA